MNGSHVQQAIILGAAGAMGNLFAHKLTESGYRVTGLDLRAPAVSNDFAAFIIGDALKPSAAVLDALRAADILLIALPDAPALSAIASVQTNVRADAIVIDTLSVKAPVAAILQSTPSVAEYLSLNPMFAPSLGFAGQKIVAVKFRGGPRSTQFLEQLKTWGASIHERTAEEHDRACAVMQVATHALLLLLGRIVGDSGLDPKALLEIAPPPHRLSLALVARILSAAPEVYWDIQKDNPFAAETRKQIAAALADLDQIVGSNDPAAFSQMLAQMRQNLKAELPALTGMAAAAIQRLDQAR